MKNKNLNIFTYDYPYVGNDSKFVPDEINFLSKKFKKVTIIPLKKKKILFRNLSKKIEYNIDLLKEIYNPLNLIYKLVNILFCPYLWSEIKKVSKNNYFQKLKMLLTERYLAECIIFFIKKRPNVKSEIFYSIWSNHTLIAFYFLKKKKIINYCFSRILGSDLKGFIPNDNYIAYKNIKFKKLNLVITLNEEQKKILSSEKLIKKNLIKKNYLGINKQKKILPKGKKKEINFASCGSLIHVKNNLEILKFVNLFSKLNSNYKFKFYCIGIGYEKNKILSYAEKNFSSNVSFFQIDYIPSLTNFLKKKNINYFLNFSRSEGMSFAVMEAVSCSIPVICNKIPGNLEIICNKNGYLLDNYHFKTYTALSKKIIKDYETGVYRKKCLINFNISNNKISRKKNQLKLIKIINTFF